MKIETEAPAVVLETLPSRTWPEKGAIDFKNVKLRYRYARPRSECHSAHAFKQARLTPFIYNVVGPNLTWC
jgi:hypothetical protein